MPEVITEDAVEVAEQQEGEEWIIEKVLGSKRRKGDTRVYYLFKWKGDDRVYENVWEDWRMIKQAVEMVRAYHVQERGKKRPRPMNSHVDEAR